MAELDNKLVTFESLKETVTRMKAYANQFEPRKEVVSKAKLTYSTNYIRAYCDYVATIPATVRITDDDGSVLLVTGSANGSWRAVRLIKGETDRFHKVYYSNGYVYIGVSNDSMYTVFGGSSLKVFGSATGTEITIENAADTDKQYNTLTTTDKTIVGAINEVNGNSLDTVGFSADYKNIILNRKSGLNPYTIPISAIINNASLAELKDIDSTDVGDGKILVYDGVTNKHKYVDSSITDEFVKMDSTTDAKYLSDLIDKSTVVNDNGVLKVKKLDGQEVTITEINYLKGLTMNVMDLVNAFSNGGVKVWETPVNTYSDLETLDRSTFTDGISYIVYVLADETHSNAKTTYLCTKTSTTFFGNADSQRNFTTNPIDLANEVTGKLGTSNIDVDSLWTLLTINDTYKTLTTNNEIFGTHGAKAMYDELLTDIGEKANTTDLTTHTGDAGIHVTTTDKAKWDKVTDKVDTVDYNTHKDNTDIHITSAERTKWNNKANASVMPPGVIFPFAGSVTPPGYLLCDGQAVSRTDYPYLFDAIGTTYGEGDGSTTFNLPNLQDKFVQGAGTNTVGTEMSAGLPNITGEVGYINPLNYGNYREGINLRNGCFRNSRNETATPPASKATYSDQLDTDDVTGIINLNASNSNSIYGNSDTVQPPAICMNYIIKY